MAPSEFWNLSTKEFWWEFDYKLKKQRHLTQHTPSAGKFTEAEWEAARKRHREKQNGATTDRPSR